MKLNKWFWMLVGVIFFFIIIAIFMTFNAGAHYQQCKSDCWEPTVTPILITPTEFPCEDKCDEVTPTETPTATPSATPTDAPLRTDLSDGKSDGKSDGLSSCPSCTAAPDNYPKSNYDGQIVGWK